MNEITENRISKKYLNEKGFTLIEIMVAMVISVIVIGGVVSAYTSQKDSHLAQNQVIEMQQNIRSALFIIGREIKMIGFDPDGNAGAGFTGTGDGSEGNPLIFTLVADTDGVDNDGDWMIDETDELKTLEYVLADHDNDGDLDIVRQEDNGGYFAIAENIAGLEFVYLDDNGNDENMAAFVKAIQITITATPDINAKDRVGRNRVLVTTVKCRNI